MAGDITDDNVDDSCALLYIAPSIEFGMSLAEDDAEAFEKIRHYFDDIALFELNCALLSRADVWLSIHGTESQRRKMMFLISKKLSILFSLALRIKPQDAMEIAVERVGYYAPIVRDGNKLETIHFHLKQWIYGSVKAKAPLRSIPITFPDALIDFALTNALIEFEKSTIKGYASHLSDWLALQEN